MTFRIPDNNLSVKFNMGNPNTIATKAELNAEIEARIEGDSTLQSEITRVENEIPVVNNGTLTIIQNGETKGVFRANDSNNVTVNLEAGGGGSAVNSVNGQTGVVVLTASDVGALPNTTTIPTKTSDLTNNSGYITNSALSGYATENYVTSQGYITGITSGDVTTALGYTPYNSTNPDGYITSSAIANMQVTTNLVTSVSSSSTDSQYPSAKLFYDTCGDIETALNTIRGV